MASYLKMPKLSDTMSEGTLVKWLKSEGDSVSMDEEIAEVETDKATMTMPSFDEGILYKIYVKEGETVPLGATLALVLEEDEDPPEDADNPPGDASAAPPAEDEKEDTSEEAPAKEESPKSEPSQPKPATSSSSATPAPTTASGERIKASPLARKLAEEQGIDLTRVRGTGPGGRIVKADLDYAQSGGGGSDLGLLPSSTAGADQTLPLSGMRRVIAQRLLESKTTIPHFYLNIEIDTEPLMTMRAQVNEASVANEGPKYTVNDFIMRATVLAAGSVPEVNASFQGDSILQFGEIHLSVAVAIDDGLVTPVIRSAQTKSIKELGAEMKDLAVRARDKKLSPDEMQGGTITISNLGAFGIGHFDAIINPPQAAILSIGTITKQPVVNEHNQIVPGQRMWIGMSCDHRVVDGAVGAKFLSELKRYLETPVLLVS
ncbi:MAG: pyruvate dehydrogenase complex dihydrolipoamide acetyltransferase [Verrucomicrobiales bacterium]|nr:pyruvate dehydrogenase complex dihydrolipoamide acetyltransferase [Verrucomicrobiales bacterium]